MNSDRETIQDLEQAFRSRRMLYENREVLSDALECETLDDSIDPDHKQINEAILKGQALLRESIVESARATKRRQDIDASIKKTKTAQFEISKHLEAIKEICAENNIDIPDMLDSNDQIEYSISMMSESIEKDLSKKRGDACEEIEKHKKTMRSLGKAYNVLRDSCTCPVCMNQPVEMFCEPCGHSLCSKCTSMIKNYCYFCRVPVKKMHKLYFL